MSKTAAESPRDAIGELLLLRALLVLLRGFARALAAAHTLVTDGRLKRA